PGLRRPVECPESHDSLEQARLDSISGTGASANKFAVIPSVRRISFTFRRCRVEDVSGYSIRICVESEFSWEIPAPQVKPYIALRPSPEKSAYRHLAFA